VATESQILWEKRALQLLKYCGSQNTNIVRHFVLFSDYVITIYVITPRAIIATPSVRRTVQWTVCRTIPSCEHHKRYMPIDIAASPIDTQNSPNCYSGSEG